jgi:ketosteroid isomerase-like protein
MLDRAEMAREQLEAFNRRDVDSVVGVFAHDAEWWPLRSSTEGPYRGHEGIRAWFEDTAEMFDHFQVDVEDALEYDDVVVAFGRLALKGRGSGATAEVPIAWVFRFVGDKVVWGKSYSERREAFAEAGIEPPR